jgi:putative PIN family toxin of toxin-antitoxin system
MTRAALIVDTNVVIAGLLSSAKESPVAQILDAMLDGRLLYLLSPALLAEYRRVLIRPKVAKLHGLSEGEIDELLTTLVANAVWRDPSAFAEAPDPGDRHLWALLASQPHSILVTGDRLLVENPPEYASVISPRGCIDRLLPKRGA